MGNSPLLRVHTPAQKLPQEADFPDLTAFPFNDLGNARRLEAAFGDDLCFVQAWKKWLVWDGTRWAPDETGEVHRRMMSLSRELQRQAAILEDESRRTAVTNWSLKLGNIVSIDNALKVAGKLRGIATQPCELDSDPYLLGVENGTVDLRTGQFRDSKRGDLITKCAGARYEPSAACPIWESFLETITEGDEDLARFLRQAVGYSLTALTSEQCLLFCLHRDHCGAGWGLRPRGPRKPIRQELQGQRANPRRRILVWLPIRLWHRA
jgi:putative DNA primase/helicase